MQQQTNGPVNPEPPISSILGEAFGIVHSTRRAEYGTPQQNHDRTAALWSAYLGVEITARQVCMLNVLQKISRDAFKPKHDNLVDIAGYAENAALLSVDPDACGVGDWLNRETVSPGSLPQPPGNRPPTPAAQP